MKKLLTALLALLLAFSLTAPAMAFTSDTTEEDDSVPYTLDIYLVEYDDNDFFGVASLPESDRGYAKNEIVAAVIELYVPEDETVMFPDNMFLILTGENVDFDVADNYHGPMLWFETSFNMPDPDIIVLPPTWDIVDNTNHDKIYIQTITLPGEETYKWLFFAKVTDDDASLTATLKDGPIPDLEMDDFFSGMPVTLDGVIYVISRGTGPDPDSDDILYQIRVDNGDYANYHILIYTDEDYKSEGMMLVTSEGPAYLGVNTKGELGVQDLANPSVIKTSGDLYDEAMDFYNDVVIDVFGLDYFNIGNYVRDSYFNDLVSPRTLTATVEIEPWTAYVSIPDNIVVDPPKTGDMANALGLTMVVLSSAGALLLKKRG